MNTEQWQIKLKETRMEILSQAEGVLTELSDTSALLTYNRDFKFNQTVKDVLTKTVNIITTQISGVWLMLTVTKKQNTPTMDEQGNIGSIQAIEFTFFLWSTVCHKDFPLTSKRLISDESDVFRDGFDILVRKEYGTLLSIIPQLNIEAYNKMVEEKTTQKKEAAN